MIIATAKLKSVSVYQQGAYVTTAKKEREGPADYEERTWRDRCHSNGDGTIFIPPMAFKKSLDGAARFVSQKITGKGQQTYTKHFLAGVLVTDGVPLPIKKDEVEGRWVFVPSDGKPGGGKRVLKCFPTVTEWEGEVEYLIFDHTITEAVFKETLENSGKFIGIGVFRPINGGYHGRFEVVGVKWNES